MRRVSKNNGLGIHRPLVLALTAAVALALTVGAFGARPAFARTNGAVATPWTTSFAGQSAISAASDYGPMGIDNNGDVLMNSWQVSYIGLSNQVYLWNHGQVTQLLPLAPGGPGVVGEALASSLNGTVLVCSSKTAQSGLNCFDSNPVLFLYHAGTVTQVTGLSGVSGINDNGQVAGNVIAHGKTRPAIWSGGHVTVLTTAWQGSAIAINDAGLVAGNVIRPSASLWKGFTFKWRKGKVPFTVIKHSHLHVVSVSTQGWIMGYGDTMGAYPVEPEVINGKKTINLHLNSLCENGPAYAFSSNNIGDIIGRECEGPVIWHGLQAKPIQINPLVGATTGYNVDDVWAINDSDQMAAAVNQQGAEINPPAKFDPLMSVDNSPITPPDPGVVSGTGFPPSATLSLTIQCESSSCGGSSASPIFVRTLQTTAAGVLGSTNFTIPDGTLPGDYTMSADDNARIDATASLHVGP